MYRSRILEKTRPAPLRGELAYIYIYIYITICAKMAKNAKPDKDEVPISYQHKCGTAFLYWLFIDSLFGVCLFHRGWWLSSDIAGVQDDQAPEQSLNSGLTGGCFRSSPSLTNPRISPLTVNYECPQLSLFIHSCHILPFQPILWNRYFLPEPANTAKHSPKSIWGGRIWQVWLIRRRLDAMTWCDSTVYYSIV